MRSLIVSAALLMATAAFVVSAPTPAHAAADYYTGTVTHVSSGNIKVKDSTGKELSFLLAPSFDQIFSSDGKTTYQMKDIKPGRSVKIKYHQQLGVRYADKIIFLTP
jgi:hypothetical protein